MRLLLGALALAIVGANKPITFRAYNSVDRLLDPSQGKAFEAWFAQPSIVRVILSLNPAIHSIEQLSHDEFKATLTPMRFPGVSVTNIQQFSVTTLPNSLTVAASENGSQQSFEGPKMLQAIVSQMLPKVKSRALFTFSTADYTLRNEAELEISFSVPTWFPLNPEAVEKGGSKTVQESMSSDMGGILDKIVETFEKDMSPTDA